MYTTNGCPYCKNIKEEFSKNKINYIEKSREEYPGDWYKITELTGLPIFPTIIVNENYLVPTRDFNNPQQLLNIIDYITSSEYKEWPNELKIIEKLKTLNYSINNQFNKLNQQIK